MRIFPQLMHQIWDGRSPIQVDVVLAGPLPPEPLLGDILNQVWDAVVKSSDIVI